MKSTLLKESTPGESTPLTFGSLFSGIGGLDLGMERAGFHCAFQVEIDEYCRRVLARHWPDVPRYSDVREVGAHNLPPVDVLAGGFPCQDISSAGHGAGIEGERSGLWREFYRLIRELRPRYVLVENVEALRFKGRGLHRVLGDLAEGGYDASWDCLGAAHVGAPHLRQRLFILAHAQRLGRCDRLPLHQEITPSPQFAEWASGEAVQSVVSARRAVGCIPAHLREPDGFSRGLERIRGCGNAVVPQLAEHVARCLLAHHHDLSVAFPLYG